MAQHISTKAFEQKAFRTIEEGIKKDVKRGYLKTSMKYSEMPADYKEGNDTNVYATYRVVPASVVSGGGRQMFEVHANGKEVNNIYLVV